MNENPLEEIIDDIGLLRFKKCEYMINCHHSDFGNDCKVEDKRLCKVYVYLKKFKEVRGYTNKKDG